MGTVHRLVEDKPDVCGTGRSCARSPTQCGRDGRFLSAHVAKGEKIVGGWCCTLPPDPVPSAMHARPPSASTRLPIEIESGSSAEPLMDWPDYDFVREMSLPVGSSARCPADAVARRHALAASARAADRGDGTASRGAVRSRWCAMKRARPCRSRDEKGPWNVGGACRPVHRQQRRNAQAAACRDRCATGSGPGRTAGRSIYRADHPLTSRNRPAAPC